MASTTGITCGRCVRVRNAEQESSKKNILGKEETVASSTDSHGRSFEKSVVQVK